MAHAGASGDPARGPFWRSRGAARRWVRAPRPPLRIASPARTRRAPRAARSSAEERQTNRVAVRGGDLLDLVHQLAHQKQTAAVLAIDRPAVGLDGACVEIESRSLVANLDDQPVVVDACPDV